VMLWGLNDGVVPLGMGQAAVDALGTTDDHKELVIFERSAHSPHKEEPELWSQTVLEFIDAHR